jgi:hypothetical protein
LTNSDQGNAIAFLWNLERLEKEFIINFQKETMKRKTTCSIYTCVNNYKILCEWILFARILYKVHSNLYEVYFHGIFEVSGGKPIVFRTIWLVHTVDKGVLQHKFWRIFNGNIKNSWFFLHLEHQYLSCYRLIGHPGIWMHQILKVYFLLNLREISCYLK